MPPPARRLPIATPAIALLLAAAIAGQEREIGRISFFGQDGFDLAAIRAALPFREGDRIADGADEAARQRRLRVDQVVMKVTGRPATDLAEVCCDDRGRLLVYIGLPGEVRSIRYNSPPTGPARLPPEVATAHAQVEEMLAHAVAEGRADQDPSEPYAVSKDNPVLRAAQLRWRDTARRHEAAIFSVVASSAVAGQRRIAAQALGYLPTGERQIRALVAASFDSDGTVRNNAVRALWVLLSARPDLSRLVPGDRYIDLLDSGTWTDRNKGSLTLSALTSQRDPALLQKLRERASTTLLEMAQWPRGHALAARYILARIAAIPDDQLSIVDEDPPTTLLRRFAESTAARPRP